MALAIVAVALGALVAAGGAYTANGAHLRERTLAHWVAMNQAARAQTAPVPLPVGTLSGTESLARQDWVWRMEVRPTEDPAVRRLEIEVRRGGSAAPASRLTAYLFAGTDAQ